MAEVREIRLNPSGTGAAQSDDPLASLVSWQPMVPGGSNFRTQRLHATPGCLVLRRSLGGILFACVFAVPGTLAVLAAVPLALAIDGDGWMFGGFMLVWGALFGGAGWYMLLSHKPLCFDARAGVYFRGKAYVHGGGQPKERQGALASIQALQLLAERVRGSGRGSRSFTSHELNLVLDDGFRVNVMDHGGDIEECARQLADLLDVPVWKGTR